MTDAVDAIQSLLSKAKQEIAKVIIGQETVINAALIAILTNNHVLIEGVPGVGKTLLIRTLARVLGCDFGRIQFTPDLMPADITGTQVFSLQTQGFSLVKGPVFTTFLLADEINRAPAKTQSALLQAMQERCVTIDRETYSLPENFTVFATQNPIEYQGTYPLPEAQMDRFMLKINMGHPQRDQELTLARRMLGGDAPEAVLHREDVATVIPANQLARLRNQIQKVLIKEELVDYLVDLVRSTRRHQSVMIGAGPRATQALILGSRAHAAVDGRDFTTPDDIKAMAGPVLAHRIILRPEYEIEGLTVPEVVSQILQQVEVPR